MRWKPTTLTGWGRTCHATVTAARPERLNDVGDVVAEAHGDGLIAYGAGRSYGDAALNHKGRVLLTERLNRILSFDAESGTIVCEAGVTFADLLRIFLPRGFLVPVTPGTSFVTVGGAVANDVHGKNHDKVGSFGDHVVWFDLLLPSGESVRVDPGGQPDLFTATIGGLGLTGILLAVCFRMVKTASARLQVEARRIPDIDAYLDVLLAERDRADYSVGWIDALASGAGMGRGILETACFRQGVGFDLKPRRCRSVPVDFPGWALNSLSIGAFNHVYYRRVPKVGRTYERPADAFFYPLDAIGAWNRIYGRRGFYQFQCVIPNGEARTGIKRLLEMTSSAKAASFLGVLKTLGGEGRGLLSFPMRGLTLALDFPRRNGAEGLLTRMAHATLDHGGRVYLAKDAVLSPGQFAAMYPGLLKFRTVLAEVDPQALMTSDLARRLHIRGDA